MTGMHPSPRIEALLSSLGARPTYRDAVLGDLAEEFAMRATEQGTPAAKRWYRREALRTAPHLLLDWGRHLTPRDCGRVTLVAVAGGLTLRLLDLLIVTAIVMSLGVVPDSIDIINVAWRDVVRDMPALAAFGVTLIQLAPVVVGFLAASLYPRGRVPAALVVATVVAGSGMFLLLLVVPEPLPLRVTVVAPLWMAVRILLGGIVRATLDVRPHSRSISAE